VLFRQGSLEIEARREVQSQDGLGNFLHGRCAAGSFSTRSKEIERIGRKSLPASVAKFFCQDCPHRGARGDRVRVNTENYAELHHAVFANQRRAGDVFALYLLSREGSAL